MNQQTESGLTTADLAHASAPAAPANAPRERNLSAPEDRAPRPTLERPGESGPTAFFDQTEALPDESPSGSGKIGSRTAASEESEEGYAATPLVSREETAEFQTRWNSVQVSFVDEPRHAVEEADNLVASAIKRLAEVFAAERAKLDSQWDQGENVSTEDLRIALRRYRSFFGRLLSV